MDCGNAGNCYVYCQDNCFKNGVINAMDSHFVLIKGNKERCFENAVFNIGENVYAAFEASAYHTFYNIQIYGGIYSDILIECGYTYSPWFEPSSPSADTYDKFCQKMTGLFLLCFQCTFRYTI